MKDPRESPQRLSSLHLELALDVVGKEKGLTHSVPCQPPAQKVGAAGGKRSRYGSFPSKEEDRWI